VLASKIDLSRQKSKIERSIAGRSIAAEIGRIFFGEFIGGESNARREAELVKILPGAMSGKVGRA
jgi:hypothetical protein